MRSSGVWPGRDRLAFQSIAGGKRARGASWGTFGRRYRKSAALRRAHDLADPGAIQIVDRFHVKQHLSEVAKATTWCCTARTSSACQTSSPWPSGWADRLELANAQYLGWALVNRRTLLPTRVQLDRARTVAAAARQWLRGIMEILFVTPDYYSDLPKACLDGWGRRFLIVSPGGLALPCHAAHTLAGVEFENVRHRALSDIWHDSPGFNAFRGEAWTPEPCRSCDRRAIDFGGCRRQAFHLAGNAAATDPACWLAPDHPLIKAARGRASDVGVPVAFAYRTTNSSVA